MVLTLTLAQGWCCGLLQALTLALTQDGALNLMQKAAACTSLGLGLRP